MDWKVIARTSSPPQNWGGGKKKKEKITYEIFSKVRTKDFGVSCHSDHTVLLHSLVEGWSRVEEGERKKNLSPSKRY